MKILERGEIVEKKKIGRPTDNPRPNKISVRISDKDKEILEDYCGRNKVNRTEAISRGIQMLDMRAKYDIKN